MPTLLNKESVLVAKTIDLKKTHKLLVGLIKPEAGFFWVAMVYGVAIGLFTLAVPIAVQTLVNTIANIASVRAVTILAVVLFSTLFFSGVISAMRMRVMEYYERRVFARLTANLSLKTIMAPHSFFSDRRNTTITQRYFDIQILQKNIPSLMVDGFALVLQMLVGFTLVSFYHPVLFAFNMVILLTLYLIWKIWGGRAKRTAIELSSAKYDTAKWLNDIASAHEFFKSSRHLDYASKNTESHISNYISKHKGHFVYTFSQAVMFLILYAVASAALLGLGGWLVVTGQLSIGQLVAAELIMSAVFLGLSRFSMYLKLYYELYGAADKIGKALAIPQETLHEANGDKKTDGALECRNLKVEYLGQQCKMNLDIEQGAKVFVQTEQSWIQRNMINLLKVYEKPTQGWIRLGDKELSDYDTYELRQMITTIDRSLIIDCTIKEYFRMSAPNASVADISRALEDVEMDGVMDRLPDGLDTRLTSMGGPLQPMEFLLLKLASALLAKPKLLILNQHFDSLSIQMRDRLLKMLTKQDFTVLYFTNKATTGHFDEVLNLYQCGDKAIEAHLSKTKGQEA